MKFAFSSPYAIRLPTTGFFRWDGLIYKYFPNQTIYLLLEIIIIIITNYVVHIKYFILHNYI